MDVRDLTPPEYASWTRTVEESPTGSPYATPEYLETLCSATGGRFTVRAVFRGDELAAGVGLYWEGRGLRAMVAPRPLLFYNGPVLRSYGTRRTGEASARGAAVLEVLESSLRGEGFGRIVLKPRSPLVDVRPFQDAGWTAVPRYTLVVPLRDSTELWRRLDPNVRRLVRRARREGLQVTEDEDFDAFFRLHRQVHERKGAPLYLEKGPFRRYFDGLRSRGLARLYHARLQDGRAVSTQMVLANGHPVAHTACAASDEEHAWTGASSFLRWEVFERLCEEGFRALDLSGAARGSVTRFKNRLGGDLRACLEVSKMRAGFQALRVPRSLNRRSRHWAKRLLARSRPDDHG